MIKLKCELKKTNISVKGVLLNLLTLLSLNLYGQNLTQSYFENHETAEVKVSTKTHDIEAILSYDGISLDHGSTHTIAQLYITEEGYRSLVNNNVTFSWTPPKKANIVMKTLEEYKQENYKKDCLPDMDFFPTYEAYVQMMLDFEEKYPDLCEIIELGTLSSGRKILAAHIGDKLSEVEDEPNFLYTSSMHGDELTGFPLMLMLIDHLLCNYGTDDQITDLVNNLNIYINPLANPDGAYRGGNQTVEEAIRFNSQFVDLNRNFPDPREGPNPDGRNHQEETIIFMDFAEQYDIHLSCNIHGGIEVCNYPWDTFRDRHADDEWWIDVSREYVDTVRNHAPPTYLDDFNDGITNGFDWFQVAGGRQDFMTFFHRAREFTLEISSVKLIDSDLLPVHWDYNREAFLNYMREATYGLRGTITDCDTGLPVVAEISIPGYDKANSSVFSAEHNGTYYRFLSEGSYDIMVTAEGYDTLSTIISIVDKSTVRFNGELCPTDLVSTEQNIFSDIQILSTPNKILLKGFNSINNSSFSLFDTNGQLLIKKPIIDMSIELNHALETGVYVVTIEKGGVFHTQKLLITK